jgi:hypothetical protein
LHDLAGAKRVYIAEGEKAADAARSIGLVATTSAHGCNSPEKTDWQPLAGKEVVLLPDNDPSGREYADTVVGILRSLTPVPAVKRIDLPNLPERGDIVEWIAAGGGVDHAERLRREIEAMADTAKPVDVPVRRSNTGGVRAVPLIQRLSEFDPVSIRSLWENRIPAGKLTMLSGDPGLGKSLIAIDIAAHVTTGRPWPEGSPCPEPGGVVILSCEDDPADTIRPRLDAAGGDARRVTLLSAAEENDANGTTRRMIELSRDVPLLRQAIEQTPQCRLVIVDPVSGFLGRTDSNNNADVRRLLASLSELASQTGVAVLTVNHLRKSGGKAVHRGMGSLGFVAAARAVWGVARDPGDPSGRRRLLVPIKCNLSEDVLGLAYSVISSNGGAPVVVWESTPIRVNADNIFSGEPSREAPALGEAMTWLRKILADGPVLTRILQTSAARDGIAWRTVERAKDALSVRVFAEDVRGGDGRIAEKRWFWRLPPRPPIADTHNLAVLDGSWRSGSKPEENVASYSPEGTSDDQDRHLALTQDLGGLGDGQEDLLVAAGATGDPNDSVGIRNSKGSAGPSDRDGRAGRIRMTI